MNPRTEPQVSRTTRAGFSMPELIVVMTIMIVMATAGMYVFKDSSGNDLRAAVSLSAQTFESARNLAVTRGKRTRVGMAKMKDPFDHLRELSIFIEERDGDGEPIWEMVGQPISLPVAIRMDLSVGEYREEVMAQERRGAEILYVIFEFSPTGTTQDAGKPFVLARAIIEEPLKVIVPNKERRSGFVVRRNGTITFYHDAEQIRNTPEPDGPQEQ